MKKIITYILVLVAITSISIETTVAKEITETSTHEQTLIASDVKPTLIPKPDTLPGPSVAEQGEEGARSIFITKILPYVAITMIGMSGGIALLFIIIGGVRFAMAYGNEENVTKAKDQVMYALVGFLLSMLAYTIVTSITKIDLVKNNTSTPPGDMSSPNTQMAPVDPNGSQAA